MYVTPNSYMTTLQGLRFAVDNADNVTEFASGSDLAVGAWVHVAVVLQKPNAWIYVNGQVAASSATMIHAPADLGSTSQNWIGRSQFAADPYLHGVLDEFRIYDRALSGAEIAALVSLEN
ncbi:Arabinan endo-1,5-alpha-L-arabinosidase [Minicystis rosea]|nr:Arabinan endo-1,5-alpha-L-arabinosidase [Minicystis rosea]